MTLSRIQRARRRWLAGLMAACCFAAPQLRGAEQRWVAAWGCSPQLTEPRNMPPEPGLASNTLRQVVRLTAGGKMFRVRLSNAFSRTQTTILSAHVSKSLGGGAIDPHADTQLKFKGSSLARLGAGSEIVSDPFELDASGGESLAVSVHFGAVGSTVTGHPGSRATSYLQAGDAVTAPEMSSAAQTQHWFMLTGVDALSDQPAAAVIAFGDSITDGRGSTTDGNDRWPDDLANRCATNAGTTRVSVINAGIGGNAVIAGGLGPTALARFDHDVFPRVGARWVILFEGVNDIGSSRVTNLLTTLPAAYQLMIDKAHQHGLRIYGATITPFGGSMYASDLHEQIRQSVNSWIRQPGHFDAVVDFDAVARDPSSPAKLLPAYDTGDHLHLNPAGYHALADAIPLDLFDLSKPAR